MSSTSIYTTEKFSPTYLYIKTHNITGLKYFGKTTKSDPYKYLGSGRIWTRHLKSHGKDITTEIYGYYTDKESCTSAAIDFSKKHNIVESTEWANLAIEDGLAGGHRGKHSNQYTKARALGLPIPEVTEETRLKRSMSMLGRPSKKKGKPGTPHTELFKQEQSKRQIEIWNGSEEYRNNMKSHLKSISSNNKGSMYITDGTKNKRIKYIGPLPNGWTYGKTKY